MMRRLFGVTTIVLCALTMLFGEGAAATGALPFSEGERLVYRAMWGFIPAGEAVIEVLPDAAVNGSRARHFAMTTTTNSRVDLFYKIRERQDSFTDVAMTRTLQYRKKSTGDHPRDVIVTYDWKNRTATYASFGNAERPVEILPGSFDPLAIFFVIRTHRLRPGDVHEIPVTDGKKCIAVKATVAGRETVTIDGKVYDTFLVVPDMERLQGVVPRQDDPSLKIWFTADERQLPVKIQSKVAIGSFVFELVSASF
ncbi:MAG: DUF3108 domain-containing protein [Syntrophaceae bacterium]|nr:DUF3108 domain-containing protein [Syntrophaceae bacterium]